MTASSQTGRQGRRRQGAVLVLVLVGMLVACLLAAALVQAVLAQRRQVQLLHQRQQCFWLAEAGVEKATLQIRKSADYTGETWTVPAAILGTSQPAEVVIRVVADKSPASQRQIQVEARLAVGTVQRIVCRRQSGDGQSKSAAQLDKKNARDESRPGPVANSVPRT